MILCVPNKQNQQQNCFTATNILFKTATLGQSTWSHKYHCWHHLKGNSRRTLPAGWSARRSSARGTTWWSGPCTTRGSGCNANVDSSGIGIKSVSQTQSLFAFSQQQPIRCWGFNLDLSYVSKFFYLLTYLYWFLFMTLAVKASRSKSAWDFPTMS